MAKKDKDKDKDEASRAINKFRVSDAVMMLIITLLCVTCVAPFFHLLSKSISSNAMVMAKRVYFLPKEITFAAYQSIFEDGTYVYSFVYSVIVTAISRHRDPEAAREKNLNGILYRADKASRACFACDAEKDCIWKDGKKNLTIKY